LAPKYDSQARSGGELGNGYSLSRIDRKRDGVTLAISGEIDLANAEAFADQVHSLCERTAGRVSVDLENCVFIDSAGIRALMGVAQKQQAQGRRLELSGVRGEPRRCKESRSCALRRA
jgi:anti-anti-sigma factor